MVKINQPQHVVYIEGQSLLMLIELVHALVHLFLSGRQLKSLSLDEFQFIVDTYHRIIKFGDLVLITPAAKDEIESIFKKIYAEQMMGGAA